MLLEASKKTRMAQAPQFSPVEDFVGILRKLLTEEFTSVKLKRDSIIRKQLEALLEDNQITTSWFLLLAYFLLGILPICFTDTLLFLFDTSLILHHSQKQLRRVFSDAH